MTSRKEYRIAIDQSTSGTKVLLLEIKENKPFIIKRVNKPHRQIYPQPGWVEHDPIEIVNNVTSLLNRILEESHLRKTDIKSISITNQRETIVVWDKRTGIPVSNALVWQCSRSFEICREIIAEGKEATIQEKTGLKVDTYFSAPKLKWLFSTDKQAKEKVKNGDLAIGTIDTWIIWNLTDKKVFATEPSNASRTLLYNIHSLKWDPYLCELFETPITALPEVRSSDSSFGEYNGIPIIGVMADSQSALYAQNFSFNQSVKATLGTGCSIMMQAGAKTPENTSILKTIGWKKGKEISYVLEGVIRSCTDTLNWMAEELDLFETVQEGSELAFSVPDTQGVYLIPAQLGLGAPFWNPQSKAAIMGLSRSSTKAHIIRAGFESIAYQIKAVIDAMEAAGTTIDTVKVDGGATRNELLVQLIADVLQKKVMISSIEEMSALGIIMLCFHVGADSQARMIYPKIREEQPYQQWYHYTDYLTHNA